MAFAVIGSYCAMVLSNFLAMKKFFGGKDNKQISDEHPTFVSPDGKTFQIWGLIYLFETVTVVAQAVPSQRTDELFGQRCPLTGLDVRERLALAFLANAVWLPVFNNERFWGALVIMFAYLAFLLSACYDVNDGTTTVIDERLVFAAGINLSTSWIVVAAMVNSFLCGGLVGWKDEHGVAGSVTAAIVVVVLVAAIVAPLAILRCDLAYPPVSFWALRGIYRMQSIPDKVRFPLLSLNSTLASCAFWSSNVVCFAMVVGVFLPWAVA